MTWVKVCGLSKPSEARAAFAAGADAIGVVMIPASPRAIRPDVAARIVSETSLDSYLLINDPTPSEMLDLADFIGVTGVQMYGDNLEPCLDAARRAGLAVLQPIPVSGQPVALTDVSTDVTPLLDAADHGELGGTGRRFDASLVDTAGRDWILAGGLDPSNVAEAIRTFKPWGVDASSGLESRRGVKDLELITRFVEEAKQQ